MVQRPYNVSGTSRSRAATSAEFDAGLRQYMLGIYNYMATGLAISGGVAWAIANTPLGNVFFTAAGTPNPLMWVGIFAPIGLLLVMSFGVARLSVPALQGLYWAFVALQGVGLSVLFMVYTDASIVRTLLITASAFAALSLYGYTTKRDLTAFGSFMVMGLFGLLIAMVVSIFFPSGMLQFIISVLGVLIFAGLTAWDTQRLKETYAASMGDEMAAKTSIMGAVSLYLNFINLFQFLLMFLGQRE